MKKALIAIMIVVFLLTVMVPAVFAAPASPPNDNQDGFGEFVSNYAHENNGMGVYIRFYGMRGEPGAVSREMHGLQETTR